MAVCQFCHYLIYLLMKFQRVLTAEYVDGCKINDVAAIQSMGLSLTDAS